MSTWVAARNARGDRHVSRPNVELPTSLDVVRCDVQHKRVRAPALRRMQRVARLCRQDAIVLTVQHHPDCIGDAGLPVDHQQAHQILLRDFKFMHGSIPPEAKK